jgi:replication initiation and membrane attachment protein
MATKSVDSKSKFNIYSSFTLSSDDVSVVSLLYAPLMGSDALMLYLGFTSLLERNNLKSEEITHQDFFDIYSLTPASFTKARIKLEGIGLLITYQNPDGNYIYVVCPPLTAKNFIKDATLGLYLYAKTSKETFEFIANHFKIEVIDKAKAQNITKSFDEVYSSQIDSEYTFDKFKYILGKKPNKNLTINNYNFDFDFFCKGINLDFLGAVGITKQFREQICNLAFVYRFSETEMIDLYTESINKQNLFDYRLLKKKANILFSFKKNMNAPKLVSKDDDVVENKELIDYLDNTSPETLLTDLLGDYPDKYLSTIIDVYSNIDLPRGVLNAMIVKTIKNKDSLPGLNYFKKVAETWISDNVFTTSDAIKYTTTYKDERPVEDKKADSSGFGGFDQL